MPSLRRCISRAFTSTYSHLAVTSDLTVTSSDLAVTSSNLAVTCSNLEATIHTICHLNTRRHPSRARPFRGLVRYSVFAPCPSHTTSSNLAVTTNLSASSTHRNNHLALAPSADSSVTRCSPRTRPVLAPYLATTKHLSASSTRRDNHLVLASFAYSSVARCSPRTRPVLVLAQYLPRTRPILAPYSPSTLPVLVQYFPVLVPYSPRTRARPLRTLEQDVFP